MLASESPDDSESAGTQRGNDRPGALWLGLQRKPENAGQGGCSSDRHTDNSRGIQGLGSVDGVLLVLTAQTFALVVGVLLGVFSARNPDGLASYFVTGVALFGYAAPVFWTGILLLIAFSLKIPLFPVAGMRDVTIEGGFFTHFFDVAKHLTLPAITLASIFFALYSRLCRASMMEVLGSDYVRTAKAKGLRERQIVYKHALKNALSPVVTLAGLQFSAVVSGAVLVEAVFSWPGLGTLALQSIIARDTPVILGILFFSALVVIVGNLLTDLVLRMIDPRVGSKA